MRYVAYEADSASGYVVGQANAQRSPHHWDSVRAACNACPVQARGSIQRMVRQEREDSMRVLIKVGLACFGALQQA